MAAISSSEASIVAALNFKLCCSVQSYARRDQSKTRSEALKKRPCCTAPGGFRNRLHSIGVNVTDTTPEMRIATQIVTENSRKRRPSTPPMKRTGMKTAASDNVIDTIVNPISRDPTSDAVSGSLPISA